ncbi:MAG: hypothetical protein QNJ70_13825 [Xenococcaceae cyanobacterium MO_207.B15]|nr:hypothetical protein [Xenococcaceae cyanobacterium MO_207.B15]MDJ0746125.1 hypothetical protein [Xenococcaceae cyanobacterium MO_167.B27]
MKSSDPNFAKKVRKFYRLTVYFRWILVGLSWSTFGVYGIWGLRFEISLWLEYFTWAAVRYGLAFNIIPTTCLAFCIGLTISVLLWQSRNILWGLPPQEQQNLERQVERILAKGESHPLAKWLN